jgi:hypothetical protein
VHATHRWPSGKAPDPGSETITACSLGRGAFPPARASRGPFAFPRLAQQAPHARNPGSIPGAGASRLRLVARHLTLNQQPSWLAHSGAEYFSRYWWRT